MSQRDETRTLHCPGCAHDAEVTVRTVLHDDSSEPPDSKILSAHCSQCTLDIDDSVWLETWRQDT